tara:strand:- start:484 stop:1140 length:657 start_codon:yes stop_codon:yes gene_type:complete
MGHTQTIVAFIVSCIFILLTFGFNENAYSISDLDINILNGSDLDCVYNPANASVDSRHFSYDDAISREYLYGPFSARASCISAFVLVIGAFVMAIVSSGLDFDMEAGKYRKGGCIHEGDTVSFVSGVIFRLLIGGSFFSMFLSFTCSFAALIHQGYVPSSLGERERELFEDCTDSVLSRTFVLKLSVFFSSLSALSAMFLMYAVHYDKKASRQHSSKI